MTDINIVYLYMLLIHFLADFGLQTHDQATNKSTSKSWLTLHVAVYSFIWSIASYILFADVVKALVFTSITFVTHYITDYCTSRIGKPFWDKQDFHNGFVVVGADQLIHYVTLALTYYLTLNIN